MKNKVILVGGFHEVIELCEDCGYDIVGIIENNIEGFYYGLPILGKDADATSLFSYYKDCKLVITPDSPAVRKRLVDYYRKIGYQFATVISPFAKISRSATIGEGTIIQSGVNVSSDSRIGIFCKLNTYSNVMHDNAIANFSTIAPNAVLLGHVSLGSQAYVGANSTILPGVSIGERTTVGAGAVVTHDIPSDKTVKGIPAK